jgi:nitrogen regulatory protein P-II 1
MFMIFFVLDDPDQLMPVLDAWEKAGIRGATIIESTGLQRVKHKFVPMRFAVPFYTDEVSHQTLMAMVKDEELIQAALAASESIVGDLNNGRTGVFVAWPLSFTKGLQKQKME